MHVIQLVWVGLLSLSAHCMNQSTQFLQSPSSMQGGDGQGRHDSQLACYWLHWEEMPEKHIYRHTGQNSILVNVFTSYWTLTLEITLRSALWSLTASGRTHANSPLPNPPQETMSATTAMEGTWGCWLLSLPIITQSEALASPILIFKPTMNPQI